MQYVIYNLKDLVKTIRMICYLYTFSVVMTDSEAYKLSMFSQIAKIKMINLLRHSIMKQISQYVPRGFGSIRSGSNTLVLIGQR